MHNPEGIFFLEMETTLSNQQFYWSILSLKSFSWDCLNAPSCFNFHLVSKYSGKTQTLAWQTGRQRGISKFTLGTKSDTGPYLRLCLQGQLHLLVVCGCHAASATGDLVQLFPAFFGLALANQLQEPCAPCPAHGTFVKRPIKQSHREPHHWSHQGTQCDVAQDIEEAAAAFPGEDFLGVYAAASEESPCLVV